MEELGRNRKIDQIRRDISSPVLTKTSFWQVHYFSLPVCFVLSLCGFQDRPAENFLQPLSLPELHSKTRI